MGVLWDNLLPPGTCEGLVWVVYARFDASGIMEFNFPTISQMNIDGTGSEDVFFQILSWCIYSLAIALDIKQLHQRELYWILLLQRVRSHGTRPIGFGPRVHRHPGSSGQHHRRLLANGLRAEVECHRSHFWVGLPCQRQRT